MSNVIIIEKKKLNLDKHDIKKIKALRTIKKAKKQLINFNVNILDDDDIEWTGKEYMRQFLEAEETLKKIKEGKKKLNTKEINDLANVFLTSGEKEKIKTAKKNKVINSIASGEVIVLLQKIELMKNIIEQPMEIECDEIKDEDINNAYKEAQQEVLDNINIDEIENLPEMNEVNEMKKDFENFDKYLKSLDEIIKNKEKEGKLTDEEIKKIMKENGFSDNKKKLKANDYRAKYEEINKEVQKEKIEIKYVSNDMSIGEKVCNKVKEITEHLNKASGLLNTNMELRDTLFTTPSLENANILINGKYDMSSVKKFWISYLNSEKKKDKVSIEDMFICAILGGMDTQKDAFNAVGKALAGTNELNSMIVSKTTVKKDIKKALNNKYVSKEEWTSMSRVNKEIKNMSDFRQYPISAVWRNMKKEEKEMYFKEKTKWYIARSNYLMDRIQGNKRKEEEFFNDTDNIPSKINNLLYYADKNSLGYYIQDFEELMESLDEETRKNIVRADLRMKSILNLFVENKQYVIHGFINVYGNRFISKGLPFFKHDIAGFVKYIKGTIKRGYEFKGKSEEDDTKSKRKKFLGKKRRGDFSKSKRD